MQTRAQTQQVMRMAQFYLACAARDGLRLKKDIVAYARRKLLMDPFGRPYGEHEIAPVVRRCLAILEA